MAQNGSLQSRSRRGNGYDSAHAESFWSRFKAELFDGGGSFPRLAEAKLEISHHGAHYSAKRRHSALGYHSPNHFESQLKTTSQLCPAWLDHLSSALARLSHLDGVFSLRTFVGSITLCMS
ncbi:integrase core domain-containing protein [Hymenobacter sp. PAMC 26628]|uniref:integrase core domain-containing protein n=1 Tax=Hymenobacter sp. PAMC 26628 TaxID=1484118 RepID=UPI0012FFB539